MPDGPLLVFGPRSTTYDFGPGHPLTPRRFGPGIDLLRSLGAEPGLAPEPATDDELATVHDREYLSIVRRLSGDPDALPEAGIGPAGDTPSFPGMHEASAAVAGGSLRAVEAILRGEIEHAFHPGGGLHHAMPDRGSGFCVYDDPALAIAAARARGLRVLYLDLDVHHGDGVEEIHRDDPGVMTVSIHESGRYLFPGTGFVRDLGDGAAAGTVVNVPLEPFTGDAAWLAAVESIVPLVTASFGPDLVVSQHGADAHAWDPLAHLRLTTGAMGQAARLVDRLAHRWAGGRWLATGGGGYDIYRVVPRSWSFVWAAGAHAELPDATPPAWRERWAREAEAYGQAPLPERFADEPNAGLRRGEAQDEAEARSGAIAALVRSIGVPAYLREAVDRGWWDPTEGGASAAPDDSASPPAGHAEIVARLTCEHLDRLAMAPRVLPPADPSLARAVLAAAVGDGAVVGGAVADGVLVGVAVVVRAAGSEPARLIALGVAPEHRRRGLGGSLLRAVGAAVPGPLACLVTRAERDPVSPLPVATRVEVADRLLRAAGFGPAQPPPEIASADRHAIARLRP